MTSGAAAFLTFTLILQPLVAQGAALAEFTFDEQPAGTPVKQGGAVNSVPDASGNKHDAQPRVLDNYQPTYSTEHTYSGNGALDLLQNSPVSRESIRIPAAESAAVMSALNGKSFTAEIAFRAAYAGGNGQSNATQAVIFQNVGRDSSRAEVSAVMHSTGADKGKVLLTLRAYSGKSNGASFLTARLDDQKWHHLALQYVLDGAGSKFNFFVDHKLVSTVPAAAMEDFGARFDDAADGGTPGLTIGGNEPDHNRGFDGQIDSFRISDAALSPSQMIQPSKSQP